MLKECKICKCLKVANRRERKQGRSHIYLDQYGRQWQGLKCPDCNKELGKMKYRKMVGLPLQGPIERARNEKGMFV